MIKTYVILLAGLLAGSLGLSAEPLDKGSRLPDIALNKADGSATSLKQQAGGRPVVLVFFRGSWCPYCMKHLKDIKANYAAIQEAGYQVIAVSPDRPAKVADMIRRFKLPFIALSDSPMALSEAFGLQFTVDNKTLKKYQRYSIDLEEASGLNHYMLPHPSIYLVNADGVITFAHVNPDYKVRMSAKDILEQIQP